MSATGEKEGGMGGSDTSRGEYFCSSFHYLALSFPGSPLSPHRRNILISVTATHTLSLLPPFHLTSTHSPIQPSIHPSVHTSACNGEYRDKCTERSEQKKKKLKYPDSHDVKQKGVSVDRWTKKERSGPLYDREMWKGTGK